MSIKELFLSSSNLKDNFNNVSDELLKITGYNISNQSKLKSAFESMANIVLNKTDDNNHNLITLNTLLNEKSISYFKKVINQKKSNKQTNQLPNNIGGKQVLFDESQGFSYMNDNSDMNDRYNDVMNSRNKVDLSVNDNSYMPQPVNPASNYLEEQDSRTKELQEMYQKQSSNMTNLKYNPDEFKTNKDTNTEYNIMPFTIDDDEIKSLSNNIGEDLPLYQNIKTLQEHETIDTMKLLEEAEKNRQIINYQSMNEKQNQTREMIIQKGNRDIIHERNNTDSITKIDQTLVDPKELHNRNTNWQERMNRHVKENMVDDNSVSNLDSKLDKLLQDKLTKLQIESQPEYIEKVHYISVNSADRKWEASTDDDTRYNFQVKFKASSDFSGAGINSIFKNIISVELVSAILPMDAHIEPFDTRVYMNIMKYPYLLLKIDELDGVFMGTNINNDKAFSTLVFDKFHNTEILSGDHITSNVNSVVKTSFSNEFKRGYVRFNPAYFEKKKYYNAPLASLNKMTINLTDHRGKAFNTQNDVLSITSIAYTGTIAGLTSTDFEINPTNSFPYKATSTVKMIEITTTKYFSNRLFRIGDRIVMNGFSLVAGGAANNSAFQSFINREEGHIIINLEKETNNATATSNDGQLNKIYIPPPGTLDTNNQTLDATTYYDETTLDFTDAAYGKLINTDLQSHFLFRIVTRDVNVSKLTKPINI